MPRAQRVAAIEELQKRRGGSHVITYITSTRPNAETQMSMDVIPALYRHLQALPKVPDLTIDLYLHSNGGDGVVPWRIVTLIREFTEDFNVLIPNRAFSAATLTALGARRVLMHPMGMLGPTDPTVTNPFNPPNPSAPGQLLGISVEDVTSYISLVKEDVGIRHEDELIRAFDALTAQVHPLALGNVKRSNLQSRMLAEKLLRRRATDDLGDHAIADIIRKLTSELYFHGHPINRQEAREEVGLAFVDDAPDDVAEAMWDLYHLYETDMLLGEEFLPVQEAITLAPPMPLPAPGAVTMNEVTFPVLKAAYVESASRCDVYEVEHAAVVVRDHMGNYNANINLLGRGWKVEP